MIAQRAPLREEQVLCELMCTPLARALLSPACERRRIAMGDRRIPVCPGDKAVRLLDRHEQRVLVQPVRLLEAESVEGTAG